MRVLVVEDEKDLNSIICSKLVKEGYNVDACYDGQAALDYMEAENYDGAIMDIMIPNKDGITVLREMRNAGIQVPVLFLTAKTETQDIVRGLDAGASDYMTKPFSMIVLGRRVRALLKRSKNNQTEKRNMIRLKNTVVDLDGYKIWVQGELCEATPKEIELIKYFSQHKGIVLSRQRIIDCIWGNDAEILDRTIDTYIKNIRRKFGIDCISTVKGIGYRMDEIEDDRN